MAKKKEVAVADDNVRAAIQKSMDDSRGGVIRKSAKEYEKSLKAKK